MSTSAALARELEIRPIPSLTGYFATSAGTILSDRQPNNQVVARHALTLRLNRYGYVVVAVTMGDGHSRPCRVNRLVTEAFHGPAPSPKHHARHIDGDRRNNVPSNLAWGTSQENEADKKRHGRSIVGAANHASKLTEAKVVEARRRYAAGETSFVKLAPEFGVTETPLRNAVLGKTWKHVPMREGA